MDSVVLLKDTPNRDNAIRFMDFLMEPENITAVSNYARYGNAVECSAEFLDPTLLAESESNLPADGIGVLVEVCD